MCEKKKKVTSKFDSQHLHGDCFLSYGGLNLMKIKRTLANLSRSGSLMTMIPVDQLSLCLCSKLHKGMLPVQQQWMDAKN